MVPFGICAARAFNNTFRSTNHFSCGLLKSWFFFVNLQDWIMQNIQNLLFLDMGKNLAQVWIITPIMEKIVFTKLLTSFFIFKVGTNCHLHFCNYVFSFDVVFCRNNLPSFTSRKIQYGQAIPKVVEIFNFAKIVGKICKNEIEHVLNHFFLKWTSNNHIRTISTYVGKWNIPCCVNIRVPQLVNNVEKFHDLHCIVPKSDGSAFNS